MMLAAAAAVPGPCSMLHSLATAPPVPPQAIPSDVGRPCHNLLHQAACTGKDPYKELPPSVAHAQVQPSYAVSTQVRDQGLRGAGLKGDAGEGVCA